MTMKLSNLQDGDAQAGSLLSGLFDILGTEAQNNTWHHCYLRHLFLPLLVHSTFKGISLLPLTMLLILFTGITCWDYRGSLGINRRNSILGQKFIFE
jgi:hypothetical protein